LAEDIHGLVKGAQEMFDDHQWETALGAYQKIMSLDPQNDDACNKIAEIFSIRGQISKVINQYFTLMDILESKGELDSAIEISYWIEKLQPENVDARQRRIAILRKKDDKLRVEEDSLRLSHLYIKLGYGEKSIALLKQLQQDNPDNLDIGLQLAEMYLSYGYIQEGIAQFRKNAQALMEQGELAKAAEAFKRMKVAHSEDQDLLFTLGNLYFKLGKLDDAESEYRAILRYNLNNMEVLIALGCVCQQKGNFQDAKLAFRKILSINPQDIIAKEKLGEIFQAENQISEAIKNYLAAAHSYQLGGEPERAIKLYRRVLLLDPTNPTATRELTNLGVSFEPENEDDLAIPQPLVKPAAKLLEETSFNQSTEYEELSTSIKPKLLKPLIPKANLFKDRPARSGSLMPKPGLFKPTLTEEGRANYPFSQGTEKPRLNWKPLLLSKKLISEPATEAPHTEPQAGMNVEEITAKEILAEELPKEEIPANVALVSSPTPALQLDVLNEEILAQESILEEIPHVETVPEEPTILVETVVKDILTEQQEAMIQETLTQEAPIEENLSQEPTLEEIPLEKILQEPVAEEVTSVELVSKEIVAEQPIEEEILAEAIVEEMTVGQSDGMVQEALGEEIPLEEILQEPVAEEVTSVELISKEIVAEQPIEEEILAEAIVEEMTVGQSDGMVQEALGEETAVKEILTPGPITQDIIPIEPVAEEIIMVQPEEIITLAEAGGEEVIGEQPDAMIPEALAEETMVEKIITQEPILEEILLPEPMKAMTNIAEGTETSGSEIVEPAESIASSQADLDQKEQITEERPVGNILQELVGRFINIPVEEISEVAKEKLLPLDETEISFSNLPEIRPIITSPSPEASPVELITLDKLPDYLKKGDIGKGIIALQQSLEENPQNIEIRLKLAKLALDYGLLDLAEKEIAELISQSPMNSDYYELQLQAYLLGGRLKMLDHALYALAQLYEANHLTEKLAVLYQNILALEPENITSREALAQIYLTENNVDVALYHYQKAGELLLKNEVPDEAIRIYRKILDLKPEVNVQEKLAQIYVEYNYAPEAVDELSKLGGFYLENNLWPKAVKAYEQIVMLSPKNIVAHEKLADLYQKIGNQESHLQEKYILGNLHNEEKNIIEAQKIYEEILKERSDFYEVRRKLVDLYLAMDEHKRAVREAQILSEVYFEKKKFDAAINLYETLVNGISQDLTLREKLMQFYMLKGEREKAIQEMLILGQAYEENGAWEEAGRIFKKGLSVDDKNHLFHYHLARYYAEFENTHTEAIKELEKVFELEPKNQVAMDYYARFLLKIEKIQELVELFGRLISYNEAYQEIKTKILSELKQQIIEHPDSMETIFTLGTIYRHLAMIDEAIEQFQVTRKSLDYRLASYNMLGLSFAAKPGKSMFDTAVKQFRKGIDEANFSDEDKIELIYNLAKTHENFGELSEALQYYNRVLAIDINYRDIKQKITQIEEEMSGSSKVRRLRQREAGD